MTSAASSGSAAGAKALVWFPDTSALVTLAVQLPLQQAVQARLSAHRRVLVTAVVAELEELAKSPTPAAAWAGAALDQLSWLGEPVRLDDHRGDAIEGRRWRERWPMDRLAEGGDETVRLMAQRPARAGPALGRINAKAVTQQAGDGRMIRVSRLYHRFHRRARQGRRPCPH